MSPHCLNILKIKDVWCLVGYENRHTATKVGSRGRHNPLCNMEDLVAG